MKLKSIQEFLNENFEITTNTSFEVKTDNLQKIGNTTNYNKIIREQIKDDSIQGVYIWSRSDNDEILYVGMSGKLIWGNESKSNITNSSYSIRKRLISSRGKYELTEGAGKTELTTYNYLNKILFPKEDIESMKISVFKVEINKYSPTYIEACILQEIYEKESLIPKYNKSF